MYRADCSSSATELNKTRILGNQLGFLEVLGRMLTATELTKRCILGNQGLFRGTGLNANSNLAR